MFGETEAIYWMPNPFVLPQLKIAMYFSVLELFVKHKVGYKKTC